jgi:polyisoprenyl-teichoic acid--peptidoglycan teichoic acid transferase
VTSVDEHGPGPAQPPRRPPAQQARREPPPAHPDGPPPAAPPPAGPLRGGPPRAEPSLRPARPRRSAPPPADDRPTAPVATPAARPRVPGPGGLPRTKRATVGDHAARWTTPPSVRPAVAYHGPTPEEMRRDAAGRTRYRRFPGLGKALLATLAATVLPGSGHLMLRRYRTGAAILAAFVLGIATLLVLLVRADRSDLLGTLLSSRTLVAALIGLVAAALAWMAVIVRTYLLARPARLRTGQRVLGIGVVTVLCLTVAAPLGFGAELANSQRQLLNRLFPSLGGGTPVAEAIGKARLNVLLVGSDAGPDRRGARTDTMMVASVDTHTGRTILFGLPRNIQRAQFPAGSPMAKKFPNGFHDNADPLSGDYLLNALYAYGHEYPDLAPAGPTTDPGLNLLHSAVETMLGVKLDYYVEVNMAGFASIIDALGGLTVDVGPEPLPVGGITPTGRHVKPDRYIPAGTQHLDGTDTLAVARSRTNSDDYTRMGRQRCLLQYVLQQKSPANLLTNFQAVAAATTDSVSTNIPQQVLPALVKVADNPGATALESVSFDPNLADPSEPDGRFDTSRPDVAFMRQVVRNTIKGPPPAATAPPTTSAAPTSTPRSAQARADDEDAAASARPAPTTGATSLSQTC